FRPDRQRSGRDQPVQLRVWTELTRPARARRRQLRHRAACLPIDGSTGGVHCYLARDSAIPQGGPRHRLDIVARRPENAVAPSWRGSVSLPLHLRHPPALIEIETTVAVKALSVAVASEGSAMPA